MEESDFLPVSDLMAALMIIFMFISISFMVNEKKKTKTLEKVLIDYQKSQNNIKDILLVYENSKKHLNDLLHQEFDKDLKKFNAEITNDNRIIFYIPFESGKSEVPDIFKNILTDFFPRYIKIISSYDIKPEIKSINIEGHTSNIWTYAKNNEEVYINNLKLSQARAKNVLIYVYSLDKFMVNQNRNWLEKTLKANGLAFAHPLIINGYIDWNKSKRVEFKVITKSEEKIEEILKNLKKN